MECTNGSISERSGKSKAHAVLVPLPALGHVTGAMRLGYLLSDLGIKITLFTTDTMHARLVAKKDESHQSHNAITIVSFPDRLETDDGMKVLENFAKLLPGHLAEFIRKINRPQSEEKISCLISDTFWALQTAKMMGLKRAPLIPFNPGAFSVVFRISELTEAGIIDDEGYPKKDEEILLSPYLPALSSGDYMWNMPGRKLLQKFWFELANSFDKCCKDSDWVLGNWFRDLDPSADDLLPNVLPIGPLLASSGNPGNLWSEDSSCLNWLDKQPPRSVIYIAFGSTTKFNQHQFDELALGLELVGRPFLWVIRSNFTNGGATTESLDGFRNRTINLGEVVQWAPQEQVLAHPSVACFLTHSGWNSVLESISLGVPMLCWPYLGDHQYNRTCVCYGWKVGLDLKPDENGIVTSHQIKMKVDQLLSNTGIRYNSLKLKALAQKSISPGGSSSKNLQDFVAWLNTT